MERLSRESVRCPIRIIDAILLGAGEMRRSRAGATRSRKVRTPQGMTLGNAQEGKPYGKRNRKQTANASFCLLGKGETVR